MSKQRGNWASRLGFILAAAGSAVGLGNIWKFPYVTGRNGGGLFVMVYLACVALVGLPIMMAEVLLGRATQASPVVAFRTLAGKGSPWTLTGWMGVAAGFMILSFYSVVAGWTLMYIYLSLTGSLVARSAAEINGLFGTLVSNPLASLGCHGLFMAGTVAIVAGGVQSGIERTARVLMPALFITLLLLLAYSSSLEGFGEAMAFIFSPQAQNFSAVAVLEAMGQAFFSLSLGMGAMLTYGSYLDRDTGIVKASLWVALLDTAIALISGSVIFPIVFTNNLPASGSVGLVFKSLPIAFSNMPAGQFLAVVFFVLLAFAALTSTISLQEVVTSSFIDLYGWSRRKVAVLTGLVIFLVGVPSALSFGAGPFGAGLQALSGRTFFDHIENVSSNWMLPLGGMIIAVFVGFCVKNEMRYEEFTRGTPWGAIYAVWLTLVRYVVPLAVALVLLYKVGALGFLGLGGINE